MNVVARIFAVIAALVGLAAGGCSVAFTSMLGSGIALIWLSGFAVAAGCFLLARFLWRKSDTTDGPADDGGGPDV